MKKYDVTILSQDNLGAIIKSEKIECDFIDITIDGHIKFLKKGNIIFLIQKDTKSYVKEITVNSIPDPLPVEHLHG